MTIDQLAPKSGVGGKLMELPMMMPLPLTTALHNQMKKGMDTMSSFMSQMSLMMPPLPQLPNLKMMMPSMPMPIMSAPPPMPCDMGGYNSPVMMTNPMPRPDFMSMLRELTQQLSPMNLINNMSTMMRNTRMAMGMPPSPLSMPSSAPSMAGPCAMGGGD
jgi:hypothetical protein